MPRGRPRKVLTPEQAAQIIPDLPAAGAPRIEELAQRKDLLAEAAETTGLDKEAYDPSRFEVQREVRGAIMESIHVSHAQKDYVYSWQRFKEPGATVEMLRAQSVYDKINDTMVPTWEVVQGRDMPEAKERMDVNGYRIIADTMLMRCRRDRHDALDRAREAAHLRQFQASSDTGALQDVANKMGGRVREVRLTDPESMDDVSRAMLATTYEGDIRRGSIPGMPAPGR